MTGRHAAAADAPTEAFAPITAPIARVTPDELADWEAIWAEQNPDAWMEPLRKGGARAEARMRATFRERGLLLARRVSRKALRLRRAVARMGES